MDPEEIRTLIINGLFAGGGLVAVWGSVKAAVAYLAKRREQEIADGRADAKDWGKEYKSLYEETKARLDETSTELEALRKRAFSAEERAHRAQLDAADLKRQVEELLAKNQRLSKLVEEKERMLRGQK